MLWLKELKNKALKRGREIREYAYAATTWS